MLVVGIYHTFDAPAVIFPDGRIVTYASDYWSRLRNEMVNGESFEKRVADILSADLISAIDKLRDLNTDSTSIFHSHLDISRIGVFGHSRGGRIPARACQLDWRIKACVNEDGNWAGQPFLLDEKGHSLEQPF